MGTGTSQEARWYFRTAGKEHGPVTYHDLDQKTRSREVLLESEVKLDADGPWQSILKIAHLLPAIASEAKARGIVLDLPDEPKTAPAPAPDKIWFLRRGTDVTGPFTLNELRSRAVQSLFAPGDDFRERETGAWKSLADMESILFPGQAKRTFTPPPPTIKKPAEEEAGSGTVTVTSGSGVAIDTALAQGGGFLSGVWEFYLLPVLLSIAKFLRNFWFVPAGILLWIVGNYFVVAWFNVPSTTESFNRLSVIHQELLTHQKNNFKGTEWENYRTRMRGSLKPMIRGLHGSADAMNPGTQHVLWAARDCVDPILEGAADSNERMSSLSKHLLEARVQMARAGITAF